MYRAAVRWGQLAAKFFLTGMALYAASAGWRRGIRGRAIALIVLALALPVIWTSEINVSLLTPSRLLGQWSAKKTEFIPTRKPDAVYVDGDIVGTVDGVQIDESRGTVILQHIREAGASILADDKPLVFRQFELRGCHAMKVLEQTIMGETRSRDLGNVTCEIVGPAP